MRPRTLHLLDPTAYPEESPELLNRSEEVRDEARTWWHGAAPRRDTYRACRDGVMGLHFEGTVTDADGTVLNQREYLARLGRRATAFNLLEPVVRQVIGQFRENESQRDVFPTEPGAAEAADMMNAVRRSMRRSSRSDELEADAFLTHLVGGWTMFRSEVEREAAGPFPLVTRDHAIHPTRAFYNLDVSDRRMLDLRLIGELVDVTPQEMVRRWARSPEDAVRILGLYNVDPDVLGVMPPGGAGVGDAGGHHSRGSRRGVHGASARKGAGRWGRREHDVVSFDHTARQGMLRVVVAYVLEYEWQTLAVDPLARNPEAQAMGLVAIPRGEGPLPPELRDPAALNAENMWRQQMGAPPIEVRKPEYLPVWRYYLLAPGGGIIRYGTSGYWHGQSPYTVGQAMMLDGEPWGLVQSVLEPQKWFNARMSDLDHAARTGGKTTNVWDKDVVEGSNITPAQLAEARVRGDTDLFISKGGAAWKEIYDQIPPDQMPQNAAEMIPLLADLIPKMTGVTEASLGQDVGNVTATQYERSVMQSGTLVHVYHDTFYEALHRKDRLEVRNIQQVIDGKTRVWDEGAGEAVEYDPAVARALTFDVAMGRAANTPTARLADERALREDVAMGLIPDATIYYRNSGRPDAPGLLRDIEEFQQQQAMQQMAAMELASMEADKAAAAEGSGPEGESPQKDKDQPQPTPRPPRAPR